MCVGGTCTRHGPKKRSTESTVAEEQKASSSGTRMKDLLSKYDADEERASEENASLKKELTSLLTQNCILQK